MSNQGHPSRGARHLEVTRWQRLTHWLRQHQIEGKDALKRLGHNRVASTVTLLLLGVVLAVPTFVYSLVGNLQQLSPGANVEPQLALYLDPALETNAVDTFSRSLLLRDDLLSVELISSDVGASEFQSYSDLGEVMALLDDNPLPAVVLVTPKDQSSDTLASLRERMMSLPQVESVEFDVEWLKRLDVTLGSLLKMSFVLTLLMGATVLLVITNTIRTLISSRQEEIEVSLLIGASAAWVRRPFLYAGVLYGLLGALVSLMMVYLSLALVEAPLRDLIQLYVGRFSLEGPSVVLVSGLLLGGVIIGWIGAFIAVSRQMGQLQQPV